MFVIWTSAKKLMIPMKNQPHWLFVSAKGTKSLKHKRRYRVKRFATSLNVSRFVAKFDSRGRTH